MEHYHLKINRPGYGELIVVGNERDLALFRELRSSLNLAPVLPPWRVTIERERMEKLP
jgi:hypothetical protein